MIDGRDDAIKAKPWRLPGGLLGMIGLVMAIEWTLSGHDLDFTAVWHWDWRVIGKAATKPEKVRGKDLLFFGDSVVKFGLMPKIISEGTGKTAFNFALHTGQPSSSYFMLRRVLRAGAKPSAVVLDLTPHMFMHKPDINKNLWAELLSAEECLDFSRTMGDSDFFARTMLEMALPSFKERREIRASLMAAFDGKTTTRRFDIPSYRRNWRLNDGAQLMGPTPGPIFDIGRLAGGLYPRWNPHPVNVAYLDRFLALAAEHEIPVYWLLPAIHIAVQDWTEKTSFDRDYTNFVKATQARYPATIVVDARHAGFQPGHFIDAIHLNRTGALKLSSAMAEVLRGPAGVGKLGEGSPRWITFDLAKVSDFPGPIEDVSQSMAILKAESVAAVAARR